VVKGISRQVILVRSPDQKLFEQAIFILHEGNSEISEESLLKEADRLLVGKLPPKRYFYGPLWAGVGALLTGVAWLLSGIF